MEQSRQTIDLFIYCLIYIIIFLTSIFIPFMIIIGIFLMPIPIIIYTAKYRFRQGFILLLILLLFSFLIGTYVALSISIFALFGGILIGSKINKQASAYETLIQGAIGYTIGLAIAYLCSHVFLHINWVDAFNNSMQDSIDTFTSLMTQFGMEAEIENQMKLIDLQITRLTYTFTAILFMIGLLFAFITQWLAYKWLNWKEKVGLAFPPLRTLNFPVLVIWIHLMVIIMQYMQLEEGSFLYIAIINILAITTLCIIIQGFSFIFFFAHLKKIHVIVPIVITALSLLLAPIFLIIIRFIGIIDIGFRWKQYLLHKHEK